MIWYVEAEYEAGVTTRGEFPEAVKQ